MRTHQQVGKKKIRMTTLTIRIDADLKDDVVALAHESGEDASTWIRRFFEGVRRSKGGRKAEYVGDDDGEFSPEFIKSVQEAMTSGKYRSFKLEDYV